MLTVINTELKDPDLGTVGAGKSEVGDVGNFGDNCGIKSSEARGINSSILTYTATWIMDCY